MKTLKINKISEAIQMSNCPKAAETVCGIMWRSM